MKFIIVALLFLTACGNEGVLAPTQVRVVTQKGAEHDFTVEMATTLAQQAQGLMNRNSLPEDAGMLFYFGEEGERSFWMKNTLIPLDIIFVKANGTIHRVHSNAVPKDLTPIPSNGDVAAVLEINGGLAQSLGIKAGDRLYHQFFTK